ncbi:MAG: hypothetical protein ACTJLM_01005 [Ehrlichia sp.]
MKRLFLFVAVVSFINATPGFAQSMSSTEMVNKEGSMIYGGSGVGRNEFNEENMDEEDMDEEDMDEEDMDEEDMNEENMSEENMSGEDMSEESMSEEDMSEEDMDEEDDYMSYKRNVSVKNHNENYEDGRHNNMQGVSDSGMGKKDKLQREVNNQGVSAKHQEIRMDKKKLVKY